MQLQRDIGILRRVFGCAVHRYLLEADARRALAGDLVVGDGLHAEMALGEAVHVVRVMALQHIGLEQRIVRDALQRDAMIREHMLVVFQVLTDLRFRRVLQPRFQHRQHGVEMQLVGRRGAAMAKRNVGGFVRRDGNRDADQLRLHRIEAGRLGVDGDELGRFDFRDPGAQRVFIEDGVVITRRRLGFVRS